MKKKIIKIIGLIIVLLCLGFLGFIGKASFDGLTNIASREESKKILIPTGINTKVLPRENQ